MHILSQPAKCGPLDVQALTRRQLRGAALCVLPRRRTLRLVDGVHLQALAVGEQAYRALPCRVGLHQLLTVPDALPTMLVVKQATLHRMTCAHMRSMARDAQQYPSYK